MELSPKKAKQLMYTLKDVGDTSDYKKGVHKKFIAEVKQELITLKKKEEI